MRRTQVIGIAGGVLLILGACWWALREEVPAHGSPDGTLRRRAPAAEVQRTPIAVPEQAASVPTPLSAAPAARDAAQRRGVSTSTHAGPLEITVLHTDGAPATGATVAVGRLGVLLAKALTDSAGRASVSMPAMDDGSALDVAIGGVSAAPVRRRLPAAVGAHEIALPDGATVEGRVLVDGAPPRMPLVLKMRLGLSADRERARAADVPLDDLRGALTAHHLGYGQHPSFNAQLVGTDGRFRFSALQADLWHDLQGDNSFLWEPPSSTDIHDLQVRAARVGAAEPPPEDDRSRSARPLLPPATGLVLRLRSMPLLTGRIVQGEDGPAVPLAQITAQLVYENRNSGTVSFTCDDEGRFMLPMRSWNSPLAAITLTIKHPEGIGFRVFEVGGNFTRERDLGDIALEPMRTLEIQVQDPSGVPIEGALAVSDDARALRSPLTGPDGRCTFPVAARSTPSITVWAPRHFHRTVMLAPGPSPATSPAASAPEPLPVVLERASSLDVTVVRADGSSPEGLELSLRASQALFHSAGWRGNRGAGFIPYEIVSELGMTGHSAAWVPKDDAPLSTASGRITFQVPEAGMVRITDLLPGVPFELVVHDQWGCILHGPQALSLPASEWRELTVQVSSTSRDLVLVVSDPQGRPLQAFVANRDQGLGGQYLMYTDEHGMLRLEGVEGAGLALIVSSVGHGDAVLQDPVPPADGAPLRVVLQPERSVTLSVRDELGRAVPPERVAARLGQHEVGRHALADRPADRPWPLHGNSDDDWWIDTPGAPPPDLSRWVFIELPAKPLVIEAVVGDRVHRAECDAGQDQVEIVVPATGELSVRWDVELSRTGSSWLEVRGPTAEPAPWKVWLHQKDWSARSRTLPAVTAGRHEVRLIRRDSDGTPRLVAGPATADVAPGGSASVHLIAP